MLGWRNAGCLAIRNFSYVVPQKVVYGKTPSAFICAMRDLLLHAINQSRQ
jgi:hypothetical protein